MKTAISNIAWPHEEEPRVADLLAEHGLQGVEIAPTAVWERPLEASDADIQSYRELWNARGIEIVALQALLFGKPELTLFESEAARARTLEHLKGMARIGHGLGARALVLGAPKNRLVGSLSSEEAEAIAVSFFRAAGEAAAAHGVLLCIEPNPREYGCDFVTDSSQGLALVKRVASPGFGLHLDAAAMTLAGEPIEERLAGCGDAICHFHASEPFLAPLGEGGVDHDAFARGLRDIGYRKWVSVEMRYDGETELSQRLERTLTFLDRHYGRVLGNSSGTRRERSERGQRANEE